MTFTAVELDTTVTTITQLLAEKKFAELTHAVADLSATDLGVLFSRLHSRQQAVVYRLLPKERALETFEALPPAVQSDLLEELKDREVARLFAELEPDDRMWLLDEVPANLAAELLRGLPEDERALTATLLGYPVGSVGRRMTPDVVSTRSSATVSATLQKITAQISEVDAVYVIPVLNDSRQLLGVVQLRDLLGAQSSDIVVSELMEPVRATEATRSAEEAAREVAGRKLLALPIVDRENRLLGMLTVEDAMRILEQEASEDVARQGGAEPLRRPYLATPVFTLVRSRVVWLLVLALGATLTVQVLSSFDATLSEVTALALFVPLLIGTGGNTGNQAATTVTRALALGDVRTRDVLRVLTRELRTGLLLGLLLGSIAFVVTTLVFSLEIGIVIGLTLTAICATAATVGGIMPLLARKVKVDPAVFSNPFISTFVDSTGLIIYFMIARAVLQL